MFFSILLALIMTVAALIFAFQNAEPARVTFLVWQFESSLALILVVSFAAGLLSGMLLLLPGRIRGGLTASGQRRELAATARKLEECQGRLEEAERKISGLEQPEPADKAAPGRTG